MCNAVAFCCPRFFTFDRYLLSLTSAVVTYNDARADRDTPRSVVDRVGLMTCRFGRMHPPISGVVAGGLIRYLMGRI